MNRDHQGVVIIRVWCVVYCTGAQKKTTLMLFLREIPSNYIIMRNAHGELPRYIAPTE